MKTILLLGGHGFLGSNVIDYASKNLADEYRFIVFDFYRDHPLGFKFDNVVKIYKGDFTNYQDIKIIFEENVVDYVFHFVSTTVPATSNNNILYDIESNLLPTINLLDLCRNYNIQQILFISSGGAVYGASANFVHKEEDALFPNSSYGIMKLTIEKYLKLYHHLYGLNYLSLRLSNPYGIFHFSDKQGVINIALRRAMDNREFEVWGDGTGIKDYIYSEDVARIIFLLLGNALQNTVLNVGSGKGHSINEILQGIQKFARFPSINYKNAKSFDVSKVVLNTDSISKYLNFKLTSLEEGIEKTYRWMKKRGEKSN